MRGRGGGGGKTYSSNMFRGKLIYIPHRHLVLTTSIIIDM